MYRPSRCRESLARTTPNGHELWAHLTEGHAEEIVERDDGFVTASDWPKRYFADFNTWPKHERQAMRFVQGWRSSSVRPVEFDYFHVFSAGSTDSSRYLMNKTSFCRSL
jgi:hypothetical protein